MVFLFYSVHRWIILIKFLMLTQTCLPGINSIWSWCISIFLFIHCRVQFANILRIFISIFMRNIGLFSFLVIPFSGFVPHTVFLRSHLYKYFVTSLTNPKLNCSEVCFHGHWKVPKSHMKEVKTKSHLSDSVKNLHPLSEKLKKSRERIEMWDKLLTQRFVFASCFLSFIPSISQ